jgi:hypothetical protein
MTARRATLLLAIAPSLAGAQTLEPRLYLPLPTGRNAIVTSYTYSSGSVVVDGTLPITDFRATAHNLTLAYVRTLGLFGRAAQIQAVAPFVFGTARAVVAGQDTSRDLRGPADPQLRLAVNLKGGPARRRSEMAGVRFGTIVGASLSLALPLGHYDRDRYLNVGANRWALKPELGVVQPLGRSWALEGYAGVWLFGRNTAYVDTSTVTQQPLWSFQGHLIRLLGRRGWLALDGTLVRGGSTAVDDVVQNTFQRNLRLGATAGWSPGPGHALKAAFSRGVYTRFGGDFDLFSVGYQYAWGGG